MGGIYRLLRVERHKIAMKVNELKIYKSDLKLKLSYNNLVNKILRCQ